MDSWFAGIVKVGVTDRTLQQLRASVVGFANAGADGRDVEARMRSMPPTHVAFLASVTVLEVEKASAGVKGFVFRYLGSSSRPEGAGTGASPRPVV